MVLAGGIRCVFAIATFYLPKLAAMEADVWISGQANALGRRI